MSRDIDTERYGLRDTERTCADERHDDATVNIATLLAFIDGERSEWMDLDGCIAGIRGFLAGIRSRR